MAMREIPKDNWNDFFNDFTRKHQGKKTTANLFGPGTFGNEEAHELPFVGISLEAKGSEAAAVRVQLGDTAGKHLDQAIPSPTQVWARTPEEAGGEMLEVHGGDGHTLMLKLH